MHFKPIFKIMIGSIAIFSLPFITTTPSVAAKNRSIKIKAVNPRQSQTLTLTLKNRNDSQLGRFIYRTVTPGNSDYHKYLSPRQFGDKYGLSTQKVKVVGKYLHKNHLKTYTYPGNIIMKVSGSTKNVERAFHVHMIQTVKKSNNLQTKSGKIHLPNSVRTNIKYIDGFTNTIGKQNNNNILTSAQVSDKVKDQDPNISDDSYRKFGRNYHTDTLYQNNNNGQHQTIGIISMSNFKLADVNKYLAREGVASNPQRIRKIMVDNKHLIGNQFESTMDMEQASVMAPQANVNAYTGGSMIDDYATAIGRDNVDVLSSSYGTTERGVKYTKGFAQTINLLMKQAAAQGITSFNASGDNGPYAFQEGSTKMSLYFPATSPYTTATGGTTLPFKNLPFSYYLKTPIKNDKVASLDQERAWSYTTLYKLYGQQYIKDVYEQMYNQFVHSFKNKLVRAAIYAKFHPNKKSLLPTVDGSGGGFSKLYGIPDYQKDISGTNSYQAKQLINLKNLSIDLNAPTKTGTQSGRNVPDVSANADPLTGYGIYMNGKWIPNGGGTSVVSPQFAGMAALINQKQGQRMGFWNPQIYRFAKSATSPFTPLNSSDNDNLYYTGQPDKLYNQATGLGTVDFTKLNQAFSDQH